MTHLQDKFACVEPCDGLRPRRDGVATHLRARRILLRECSRVRACAHALSRSLRARASRLVDTATRALVFKASLVDLVTRPREEVVERFEADGDARGRRATGPAAAADVLQAGARVLHHILEDRRRVPCAREGRSGRAIANLARASATAT